MKTLKLNDQGKEVTILQNLLKARSLLPLCMLGVFDSNTDKAVKAYQASYNLTPDGVVGPNTWGKLNTVNLTQAPKTSTRVFKPKSQQASHLRMTSILDQYADQIDYFARQLALPSSLLASILAVESSGNALSPQGEPIIRFEVHWFHKLYGAKYPKVFDQHFKFDTTEPWKGHQYRVLETWKPVHTSQETEQEAYELARGLSNDDIASQCMSIGLAQLMGFHYKRLGYSSARDMYLASFNPQVQVLNFLQFIASDPKLYEALQLEDLKTFTTVYNGSGQVDKYSKWIADNWLIARAYI